MPTGRGFWGTLLGEVPVYLCIALTPGGIYRKKPEVQGGENMDETPNFSGTDKSHLARFLLWVSFCCLGFGWLQHYIAELPAMQRTDSVQTETADVAWTDGNEPTGRDKEFLDSLDWHQYPVGDYAIRTGIIRTKYIAALQFVHEGNLDLTEYTPPMEYIEFVDPLTGQRSSTTIKPMDLNNDGVDEIILLNRKLNDPEYSLFSVYSLNPVGPKLIWSGADFYSNCPYSVGQESGHPGVQREAN
jgi:hypothetical protein